MGIITIMGIILLSLSAWAMWEGFKTIEEQSNEY